MGKEIVVSIVCNVYNHGKYLRDCLNGFVMQQTNFPYEILIHDDASTDDSADIIREYEKKFPEIIKPIYQMENQYSKGVSINKTFQTPRITGKYVAICEGDDYWTDPFKLQKQYDFLETNQEYSMCVTSCEWLDMRNGKTVDRCKTVVDRDISLEEIILESKGRPFQSATFFLKSDIYLDKPDWFFQFGVGDTPLAIYCAILGKIRMLSDTTAVYRNHAEGSWTSRVDKDKTYKTAAFNRMIGGLTAFDEATEGKYHELVSKRIDMIRYKIARLNRDLNAMKSGRLKEIYKSRRFLARMSDVLACKAPRLQVFMRKLLDK